MGNCPLEKKSSDGTVPGDAGMQPDQRVGLTEAIQLQIRRSSSCVSLATEPFSSWGAARVMGSGKVSSMLFFRLLESINQWVVYLTVKGQPHLG